MLEEALLGRLVVVGGHDQGGVGPALGGPAGQAEGFLGAVRSRARHHLGPAGGRFHHGRDHPLMLRVRERGALARRAHGAKAGRAGLDLEFDVLLQGLDIDLAVAKGSDHGHGQAGEIFTSGGHSEFPENAWANYCTGKMLMLRQHKRAMIRHRQGIGKPEDGAALRPWI